MLEQSLNALSYWFNHRAQLALRPEGTGRVWLAPELTDDPDPDQPASRATVELVAPDAADASASGPGGVRLEIREVWWAESFGLPEIGATISWARVQWREQAQHLLIPLGKLMGPAKTAARTPARETPQALAYRPVGDRTGGARQQASTGDAMPSTSSIQVSRPTRGALRTALWCYDLFQYLWKGLQWLFLTPLIALVLIVMGIVRLLAVVPFLRSAIIAASKAITDNVMLHWVSEIKVYLTDYTRASAIRQRFEREVEDLLRDPHCERVVVIGESGGTYIAYEGLTTLLAKPDLPLDAAGQPKPLTFVSIATALRRIWLLSETDPHRVHGIMPAHVRWLHFWARYDPVAAGPLTQESIPPITTWDDATEPNPYPQIRASLARCENVAVANSDSVFTDHVGYWDNQEQVVGPIARELVAGHPVLEQVVQQHLASRDEVLLRRWSVAWRYAVAFAAGLAAAVGLVVWAIQHPGFGNGITSFLARIDWGGFATSVCAPCKAFIGPAGPPLSQNTTVAQLEQYARGQAITYVLIHIVTVQALVVGAIAVAIMALTNLLAGWLVAKPATVAFPEAESPAALRLGGLFTTSAIGVGLVFVASLIFSNYVRTGVNFITVPSSQLVLAYVWVLALGEVMYLTGVVVTLVVTLQQRRWGWVAGVVLSLTVLSTFDPFYRTALLAVTAVGCVLCLGRATRPMGTGGKLALAAVALMSVDAGIGVTLANEVHAPLLGSGVAVEFLFPALIYALWMGSAKPSGLVVGVNVLRRAVFALATVYLGVATLLIVPYIIGQQPAGTVFAVSPLRDFLGAGVSSPSTVRAFGVILAVVLGTVMLVFSIADALRQRRWTWLVGIPLSFIGLVVGFEALAQSGVKSNLPEGGLILSFALVAAALSYTLWAGPEQSQKAYKQR
jgi:hypothetical protein